MKLHFFKNEKKNAQETFIFLQKMCSNRVCQESSELKMQFALLLTSYLGKRISIHRETPKSIRETIERLNYSVNRDAKNVPRSADYR